MNCRRVETLLFHPYDRRLPAREARAVDRHVAGCSACRQLVADLHENQAALSALAVDRHAAGISHAAIAQWERERDARPEGLSDRRPGWSLPRRTVPIVAALGVALAMFVLVTSHTVRVEETARSLPSLSLGPPAPRSRGAIQSRYTTASPGIGGRGARRRQETGPVGQERDRTSTPSPTRGVRPMDEPLKAPLRFSRLAGGDLAYLNAGPAGDVAAGIPNEDRMIASLRKTVDSMIRSGDDFVTVAFPPLAAAGEKGVKAAIAAYRQEKEIVDARLARKVTVAAKGMALVDLCKLLQEKVQVDIRAGRGIADEKVTVFCEETPARDLMRAIHQMFGYNWARTGEAGAYRYELDQDLVSRLREEELRSHDLNAALLNLDEALRKRVTTEEKRKGDTWNQRGETQLYQQLTPGERAALRNGEHILFSSDSPDPDRRISDALSHSFLMAYTPWKVTPDGRILDGRIQDPKEGTWVADMPGSIARVSFFIAHTELGQISLQAAAGVEFRGGGFGGEKGFGLPLATGRNPDVEKPNNSLHNQALRNQPPFHKEVTLHPETSCARLKREGVPEDKHGFYDTVEEMLQHPLEPPMPHLNSADVWEEVHRKTGLPIVADYYTHLYPLAPFQCDRITLFDALCRSADAVGARWRKEGDWLLCRSVGFYWDKLKEVPNRYIARWQADSSRPEGLPLDDLLEMASLSDAQLNSLHVAQGIRHCQEIDEWGLVFVNATGIRSYAAARLGVLRGLSLLSPAQRKQAFDPQGLPFSAMPPAAQDEMFKGLAHCGHRSEDLIKKRLQIDYVPSHRYVWHHRIELAHSGDQEAALPVLAGKTASAVLELARQVDPQVKEVNISPTRGIFAVTVIYPDGTKWAMGKPDNSFR